MMSSAKITFPLNFRVVMLNSTGVLPARVL
jgi:hypothetical protein